MGIPISHTTLHGHDVTNRLSKADPGEPTLLLIHGMAGNSRTWKDVMPTLAEDFTVLAPDLIGTANQPNQWVTTRSAPSRAGYET